MLFSSLIFLYLFLPITLLGYYLSPHKLKNYWLLLTSLVFFAWGGVGFTLILICSIGLNYIFGILIQKTIQTSAAYWWAFAGVAVNILLLGVFKYTNFIITNINEFLGIIQVSGFHQTNIALPIGISFYTFHSLSYLVDIYKRKTTAQKNIFDLALYITMFSQLIAGPIIRYSDVWQQLSLRTHTLDKFSSGIERFIIGLARKVLLANTFAKVADEIFDYYGHCLNAPLAWLGIICYTLQIYFDFAGYSDMAIGLGRMFGFEFKENFNFPYTAQTVKDFWRRWHISLSTFFRDYVYIPLGGSKVKPYKVYMNLLFVFFVTGFWHGAKWNFIVWGMFHGFFMLVERLGFEKILEKVWKPISNLYTILVVMFAWVLFRANTLGQAFMYWKGMFQFNSNSQQTGIFLSYLNPELITCIIIAVLGSIGTFKTIQTSLRTFQNSGKSGSTLFSYTYQIFTAIILTALLYLCTLYLNAGTYNPFIYYRF